MATPRIDQASRQTETSENLAVWEANADLRVVGHSHTRLEGVEKVTGRAQYTYDVRLPRQLYARVLRSPHPHARVVRVDTSRAAALPGVYAVASSADTPEIAWYEDGLLFDRIVRFIGDEVAAVAAESEEIADDALRLIEIAYEPLSFVTDLAAAQAPGAPQIRPDGLPGNASAEPETYDRGDITAGFAAADVVVEGDFTTQAAVHNALEPHGATAAWMGSDLTLWTSTQSVFDVRQKVAEALGLAENRVRVIKQHMGGGFGAKQVSWKQDVIAALLAQRSGRPVQLMLDRVAENLAAGNRNPTLQRVRVGATRDGALTAIEASISLATGAYQVGGEASNVQGTYQSLYRCPNVRTDQTAIYTNTGPAVAFRAPGFVEAAFALEQAMDELARTLGMDPLDLRLRNYTETDQTEDKPYSLPEALRACYERASEAFDWRGYERPAPNGAKRRGIGLAAHDWVGGSGHPPGYAWAKLNADGSVDIVTGTQDIGTGTRTGLAQIAAEELRLPLDRIALHLGDTAYGPYSPVSSGSATQATIGPAIRAAAAALSSQILERSAAQMEMPVSRLSLDAGRIRVDGDAERGLSLAEVAEKIGPEMLQSLGSRGPNPEDVTVHTFGAQCVEVEVDTETGEVTILRLVASHDCGRVINPALVESQIVGGITQGIGYALTEERIVDDRLGRVLNANLEEYKIPTVADVPPITFIAIDIPDLKANPTGAKGVGEPPLIPTAPAIANAIYDAVGIRIRDLPLTRARVLAGLADRGTEAAPPAADA